MNFFKGLFWALLISACFYFIGGIIYTIGYKKGASEVKCGQAQCMQYSIKAEQACYKRVGWYK